MCMYTYGVLNLWEWVCNVFTLNVVDYLNFVQLCPVIRFLVNSAACCPVTISVPSAVVTSRSSFQDTYFS